MAKVSGITVSFDAGTQKFILDAGKVKTSLNEIGMAGAGAGKAASLAMRDLQDGITGNSRAAGAFLVQVLGLGSAMKTIFPVVSALAFGAILVDGAKKVVEYFRNAKDAADIANKAFRDAAQPMQQTNDQLDLENAKLRNQIALLEHRPQNMIAEVLAAGVLQGDKLAETLAKDLEAMQKVLEASRQGIWLKYVQGTLGTDDISNSAQNLTRDINDINTRREAEKRNATTPDQQKAVQDAWNKEVNDKYEWYKTNFIDKKIAADKEAEKPTAVTVPGTGMTPSSTYLKPGADMSSEIRRLQEMKDFISLQQSFVGKEDTNVKLGGTVAGLEAAKKSAEDQKKLLEEQKRAADDNLKVWESFVKEKQMVNEMSASEEQMFWAQLLGIAEQAGPAYIDVVSALRSKVIESGAKITEEQRKNNEEDLKNVEQSIKDTQERVRQAGGNPEEVGLQMLQGIVAHPNGLSKEVVDMLAAQIPDAAKRASEELQKLIEKADQLSKIHIESKEQTDLGSINEQKQQAELAYAAQKSHSFQEELQYRQQIAALEGQELQIKLASAQVAHEDAMDAITENMTAGELMDAQNKIAQTGLEVDKARLAIRQQQLQVLIETTKMETDHLTTLKSGLDAFINESANKAKEPGEILYEGLNSALDKTSENLTKLFTGQKTSWAKEFKSLGESMLQSSIKSELQKAIGITGGAGKPDGTKNNPWYTKSVDNAGLPVSNPTAQNPFGINDNYGGNEGGGENGPGGLLGARGGILGGLLSKIPGLSTLFGGGAGGAAASMSQDDFSFLDSVAFPGMADGGDVSAGGLYKVGDRSDSLPEVFKPSSSGSIIPIDQLMGHGGASYSYNIDARNSDTGTYNRILGAMPKVHDQAVANSVKAEADRKRRVPKHRR